MKVESVGGEGGVNRWKAVDVRPHGQCDAGFRYFLEGGISHDNARQKANPNKLKDTKR